MVSGGIDPSGSASGCIQPGMVAGNSTAGSGGSFEEARRAVLAPKVPRIRREPMIAISRLRMMIIRILDAQESRISIMQATEKISL